MTQTQKIIKYLAMALAVLLAVTIMGGVFGAVGIFGRVFGSDSSNGEMREYSVGTEIKSLEISVAAADFVMKQGDDFLVESNLKNLSVKEKNGVLYVEEKQRLFHSDAGAVLTLTLPFDAELQRVKIKTGAGSVTVDRLAAEELFLELGAGEVKFDTLIATSSVDLEGGVGKITISDGVLNNLDLEMRVGKLSLSAALTGKCDFDLGIGESDITVIGCRRDYRLDLERGIGSITVDGTKISHLEENNGKGHSIELSGGIGSVRLRFEDGEKA